MTSRLLAFALLSGLARGELKLPDLAPAVRSVVPLGGRQGEAVEVLISGRHLDGATELAFFLPDLRARILSADFFLIRARVEVGPAVPSGLHHFRLHTPRGSHVGVFHVAELPATRESEPNNEPAQATPLALPAMADGVIDQGDDDLYRFHAEAGQTVIFDLLGTRAGSPLDAALAVLDARGRELDFIDDYYIHHDPYLAFRAPESGDYYVRVSGSHESGSKHAAYRLIAGAIPHVLRVLPAGVRRGATQELEVSGVNLDRASRVTLGDTLVAEILQAAPDKLRVRVTVPPSFPTGQTTLRAGPGNGFPLIVSDLDERLSAAARRRAQPQAIAAPVALSGILDRRRAADFFSFAARAGERLALEVHAMRLGYLLDPAVALYDSTGRQIAYQDEPAPQNGKEPPQLDPYLVHTFEKTGTYLAMIRDSAERGDPNYVYRLAVRPVAPDFEFYALGASATFYRGVTNTLLVRVRRLGGWDEPVEIFADNPPAGVRIEKRVAEPRNTPTKDTCGNNLWLDGTNVELPVHVAAGAAPGSYPIRLRARGKNIEHAATILFRWGSAGKITGPVSDQTLLATVTDLPPVLLDPPESITFRPGKPARLRVLVSRFDDAKTPLTFELAEPSTTLILENNVAPPGANQLELRLLASTPQTVRLRAGHALSPPIELKMEKE